MRLATILALIEPAVGLWLIAGSFVAEGLYRAIMIVAAVVLLLKAMKAERLISFERFQRKRKTETKAGVLIVLALAFIPKTLLAGTLFVAGLTSDALPVWARSAFLQRQRACLCR